MTTITHLGPDLVVIASMAGLGAVIVVFLAFWAGRRFERRILFDAVLGSAPEQAYRASLISAHERDELERTRRRLSAAFDELPEIGRAT